MSDFEDAEGLKKKYLWNVCADWSTNKPLQVMDDGGSMHPFLIDI